MTAHFGELPPREPICRAAADELQPCRFARICPESRQRRHHYDANPPLRGEACWVFQKLVTLETREAAAERTAIRDEGKDTAT